MLRIKFDAWKAEFKPRIYEDSGAECYDHETCECEFLYTVDIDDLLEDDSNAGPENRLWTWHGDGTITSGVESMTADILITEKPWTEATTVH
jgi:hypothetical protein